MPRCRPPVLFTLCAVELLERLAANLLGALLLFFLTERLRLPVGDATRFVGGFHALSYALAILGGWFADRFWGSQRTAGAGLVFLTGGYLAFMMQQRNLVVMALGLLIIGHGLFKPNITALFGEVYPIGDTRRERAYRLFYLVINVGTVLGPVLGALVAARAGWSATFAVAAAALVTGSLLFAFIRGFRSGSSVASRANSTETVAASPAAPRPTYGLLIRLLLGVVLFEAAMNQSMGTLLLFARDYTRRDVGGWVLPPAWFASLPALFALLITPIAALRRRNPASPLGIAARLRSLAGSSLCGLSAYGLVAIVTTIIPGRVSALWLVCSLGILTLGELYLYGRGLTLLGEPRTRRRRSAHLWTLVCRLGARAVAGRATRRVICRLATAPLLPAVRGH